MTESVRLAKRLAEMLSCSRREAELYIEGGWVMVDKVVVEEPQFRVAEQTIELHPDAKLIDPEPVTMLLHLPVGAAPDCEAVSARQLFSPATRATDDASGIALLKRHCARLSYALPLDESASGLAVFTQDWRVARKLLADAASLEQEYVVEVSGAIAEHGLKHLNLGLTFNGKPLAPAKVSWQSENRLRFALKAVRPGQIAHMCRCVGLQALSIKRIRIGRVAMAKLPPGQWRYLAPHERF